ncbi:MAG: hypothetical protein H5U10_15620 [Desulfacinum sp.]|nr:hypothetical protein [Desulfacinum sp.]
MSFYCVLTLSRCVVLAADNKRRILELREEPGRTSALRQVVLSDARKIHAVPGGWWMTGVGLSDFLQRVREVVEGRVAVGVGPGEDAARILIQHLEGGRVLADCWGRLVGEGEDHWPQEALEALKRESQEGVLARFDAEKGACVVRFCGREQFVPRVKEGPGHILFPGDHAPGEAWVEETARYLAEACRALWDLSAAAAGDGAWERIPPLFRWLARLGPDRIGPTGDLVIVDGRGHRRLLF